MTSTAASYHGSFTAAAAREHDDLLREATMARAASLLSPRPSHRTPRLRPAWWTRVTARAPRCAPRSPRDRQPRHETEGSDRP